MRPLPFFFYLPLFEVLKVMDETFNSSWITVARRYSAHLFHNCPVELLREEN